MLDVAFLIEFTFLGFRSPKDKNGILIVLLCYSSIKNISVKIAEIYIVYSLSMVS